MQRLLRPWRHGLRSLLRQPGLTLTSAAVVSLGVTAVATIVGLLSGPLLRPLPYPAADRLVFVFGGAPAGGELAPLAADELRAVRDGVPAIESLAGLADDVAALAEPGRERTLRGIRAGAGLAQLLGLRVERGRLLRPDEAPGYGEPLLIRHDLWEAIGAPAPGGFVVLDGSACTLAGVIAPDAELKPILGFEPAWWRPLGDSHGVAIARLRDGTRLAEAQSQLVAVSPGLRAAGRPEAWALRAEPARPSVDAVVYALAALALAAILGIVGLNAGSLLLARALARSRETALQRALGAGAADLVGERIAEGVVLGSLSGAAGLAGAAAALRLLRSLVAGTNAESLAFDVDAWVVATALLTGPLVGLAANLYPALYALGAAPEALLREGAHGATESRSRHRARRALVAGQVALSLAFLSVAGLAVESLRSLLTADRGFRADGVLAARVEGPDEKGRLGAVERTAALLSRVSSLPGVHAASVASAPPVGGSWLEYHSSDAAGASTAGRARVAWVGGGYFEALGMRLRSGRALQASDAGGAFAVVNDTLGLAPGDTIEVAGRPRLVVGVVAPLRNPPLQSQARHEVWLPWDASAGETHLLVRTSLERPLALAPTLADALRQDGLGRLRAARSLEDALAADLGVIRLGSTLLGILGLGALALAAAGTFGVVAALTAGRTREIGVRIALGATAGGVVRLMALQGLQPVATGGLVGILLSLAIGRLLASRVHGLQAVEPLVLGGALALVAGVVGLACYWPARRATRVPPAVALRCE